MSHSYTFDYPSGSAMQPEVIRFFQDFYQLSDTPDGDDLYPTRFTEDATFILASRVSRGRAEILETRKGMWATVSARRHTVHKVFPFGKDSNEFMLHGVVNYTFKTGGQGTADWAGKAVLEEQDGVWRFKFYQVYLDTGSQK
ncbi:hypothetical protein MPDQ_003715 [Monascus purpureus]|uniref:SnoaL-like domain-containing protein n=1 Tax=Monascus purpureus TaxID=5098 RepID=A0A507QKX2_MONPU|nr:hypothetical protein MPDQ_003715 [Monascus purpureus]